MDSFDIEKSEEELIEEEVWNEGEIFSVESTRKKKKSKKSKSKSKAKE